MRQIKFRYRVEFDGKIETLFYTQEQIEQGDTLFSHKLCKILSRDEWTGLKDKKGTMIFESDIVRVIEEADEIRDILKVVWSYTPYDGQLGWTLENSELSRVPFYKDIEVIGNVWENKELLK